MKYKRTATFLCALLAVGALTLNTTACNQPKKTVVTETYNVMSFNIRTETSDDKAEKNWSYRYEYVKDYVLESDMDVICMQEVRQVQYDDLKEGLKEKYEVLYFPRETGSNPEGLAICYSKEFQLVESDMFWLSETPNEMSLGWGANYYRICAYALLYSSSGVYLDVFNVHLDHQVEEARTKGLELILDKVSNRNYPAVVCGDFNTTDESQCYATISDVMWDCQQFAPLTDYGATYQNWGAKLNDDKAIDFCFVTGDIDPLSFDIMQDTISEGVYYSDHFAVSSQIEVNYTVTTQTE